MSDCVCVKDRVSNCVCMSGRLLYVIVCLFMIVYDECDRLFICLIVCDRQQLVKGINDTLIMRQ